MNSRPFPQLIRTAAIVLAGVLLFNFLAYYLTWQGSRENEKMVRIISMTGHQRMVSQQMVKDILLVLSPATASTEKPRLREQLISATDSFLAINQVLRQEMARQDKSPSSGSLLEITRLLTNAQTHVNSMASVAREVAHGDSILLEMNGQVYTRLYGDRKSVV